MTGTTLSPNFGDAKYLGKFENHSEEWHAVRAGGIGGSEVSTIVGVNPWESPFGLWAKKTGKIPESFEPNEAMEWGTRLEDVIMDKFIESHPEIYVTKSPGTFCHKDRDWQITNPDGLGYNAHTGEDFIIEIKTARYEDDWLNGVPAYYKTQVQWYLQTFGYKKAYVAVLFSGSKYREFLLEADEFEQQVNLMKATEFRKFILEDRQPDFDGAMATYETIRKLHPNIDPDGEEELGDLGIHYFNALSDFEAAQSHLNEMKSRVLDAMGNARKGLIDGAWKLTRQAHKTAAPFLVVKKGS